MNYFITHCNFDFLKYAERLFETLEINSENKIIFYTVDFVYNSRFKNVIPVKVDSKKFPILTDDIKARNVFLKPFLMQKLLSEENYKKDTFCYLDSDCLALENCDTIFDKSNSIEDYPLFNRGCHEFMMMNGKGDPFVNGNYDLNLCLEAELMNLLQKNINLRKQYLQTGVFLFNFDCKDFIKNWADTCGKKEILNNWQTLTPFHEETVANCLLWSLESLKDLSQSLINLPYNTYDYSLSFNKIKEMLDCLNDLKEEDYFIDTFCRIPSKINIKNLCFYHGKISDEEYYYIKKQMSDKYLLKINSVSLGDTLAATPTLRKLYHSYGKKIDIITHHVELFKNNKYVNKAFSFSEKINQNHYKEIFNTFLGVGGKKNEYNVEKKHNTIDIRQFHAIDLGFMLNDNEMEYDYIPDAYTEIKGLPKDYICLHVADTWPSRTYSDENWQQLINLINEKNIQVVLVGKNSHETGFYNIDKPTKKLNFKIGLDLTNRLSVSQCWHVINKSKYFITMDSGLLHLAGTTDANIIQLGSSINYKLRAPYRRNSQSYKYKYIGGSCDLFCASDIKYGVKEWKTIQGVPPLIKCLENKSSYECHPKVNQVVDFVLNNIFSVDNESLIEIQNFNPEKLYFEYFLKKEFNDKIKLKIIDDTNGFILHQESLTLSLNNNFWTSFEFCKNLITNSVSIIFESNGKILLNKKFIVYEQKNINIFSNLSFERDIEISSYSEIFYHKTYCKYGLDINENDVVVDIGSNQGAFIKYALDKKSSLIYSCDPNPACISLIKKYYGNNKNLFLNEFAISDKCGESFLHIGKDSEASGCAKISEAEANINFDYQNGKKIKINSITFQEFIKLNKINRIDFLKIDCEGGEVFVFTEENKDFIKNNIDKIVLEFHNEQHVDIINYLRNLNYEVNINYSLENLGMIFAKNKNTKKIGLLLTAYNCENYINLCLDPWMKLKEKYNIKIATNSGMFSDYKTLGFKNKNQSTLEKLNQYKFDYFIKTDGDNLLDEDSSRNKCLQYLINEQSCDLIWILDADEIYKQSEIEKIINYINANEALYYSVNFKNYIFTRDHSVDYVPPRIFWTNKNLGIKKFHFDNHVTYYDGTVSEAFSAKEIPKNIAHVDHYSWLAEDSRTKEKIIYQNKRFAGEDNARCSFVWDDNYDCLIFNENFYEKRNLQKPFDYNPPKYLFITAHLSTGGSPKYLEWLIKQTKKKNARIKVIEWNLYSNTYVVQRNLILDLVGSNNFYSVGSYAEDDNIFYSKEQAIINYIKDFDPDFIHLNEFSENFAIKQLSSGIINFLYDKNKKHKLLETTHSAQTDILNKKNIPDELWLVSKHQYDIAKTTNIKSVLMEMELPNKARPNREKTLICLGLDPDKIHVLQVGLFTVNKNQKFTFDVAKNFINSNILFHFIGNDCFINECGIDKNQSNCRIWGERSDVDSFMSCMDLFVMPSYEELNPIALKEAISWGMTCFVSELPTIKDQYKNNKNVKFINGNNLNNFITEMLSSKNNNLNSYNFNIFNIHNLNAENNKIICNFFPNPKVEILGSENIVYNVKFIDEMTNITHYETNINTNMWTTCSIQYFCKWKIIVTNTLYNTEQIFKMDLENKLVKIINESNSLGDAISWMSAIDVFQKFHNCKIDYYTCKKDLFSSEYPNINFYDYDAKIEKNYYAQYKIGCFSKKTESNLIKNDWRNSNLQKIAFEILGLSYSEKKSKIRIPNKHILKYKYVCIATQSTSQSRYWNHDGGWEKIIDYIKEKGYKVICVDKHFSFGSGKNINICPKNIDYFAGERSFEDIIDIINNCEFFIGLSSGLSWLAWALNKKIIKINSSVDSAFEFYTPYIVENKNVCNGCFNSLKHNFDPSNWNWCPENKNYECSKNITDLDVIRKIDMLLQNKTT